jgi:hypothetical protein
VTSRARGTVAILAAAIVLSLGLRTWGVTQLRGYSHDGVISFLAATANQQRWAEHQARLEAPFAQWTPAAQWRELMLEIHEDASLRRIATDLTREDTHPPLYFWALHYAVRAWGIHPRTGALIDMPVTVLAVLALYALARTAGMRADRAALVALVWGVSMGAVTASWDARQYGLFTLLGVLFAWMLLLNLDERDGARPLRAVGLAAVTAAGMLTHYYFATVISSGLLAVLIVRAAPHRRRLAQIGLSVLAGALAMMVVHPGFMRSVLMGDEIAGTLGRDTLAHRLYVLGWTTGQFVTVSRRFAAAAVALVIAGLIVALIARADLRAWLAAAWREAGLSLRVLLLTGGLLMVTTWVFLFKLSPPVANAARYMAPVWPFVALAAVYLLDRVAGGRRRWLLAALPLLLIAMTTMAAVRNQGGPFRPMIPTDLLAAAERAVTDTAMRGAVVRLALLAPPEMLIFSAPQERLIDRPEEWLPELERGDLVVSQIVRGNTSERRLRLEELLAEEYEFAMVIGTSSSDDHLVVYEVRGER